MRVGKTILGAAALMAASTPIAAQAVAADRAAAPVAGESEMGGGAGVVGPIFVILALAAFLVAGASDEDEPASA